MTISKYISDFLKLYDAIRIDTNHIQDGADKYGLFKSPGRIKEESVDGSAVITENYQFFAKQATVSETERKEADEWLEDLTYWCDDYIYTHKMPPIDGGRQVLDIQITGCPTPMETQESETLFQISLSITYSRD